jgi:hypothetical protein
MYQDIVQSVSDILRIIISSVSLYYSLKISHAPITNYCLPYQRGVSHTLEKTGIDEPTTDMHVIFSNSLRRT